MAGLTSTDVLGIVVGSATHAGFVVDSEIADGFPLATITMKDGSRFNVQVRKISEGNPQPVETPVEKRVKLRLKRPTATPI